MVKQIYGGIALRSVFKEQDIEQMRALGIDQEQASEHLKLISKGAAYARLLRPATVEDGIVRLEKSEHEILLGSYAQAASEGRLMKFVPASGAASRMFRDLLNLLNGGPQTISLESLRGSDQKSDQNAHTFFTSIRKFAFYRDLKSSMRKKGFNIDDLISSGALKTVLSELLTDNGLNYAQLPKALIKFHSYGETTRTALEEHLVEVARNLADKNGVCRLHLTLNPEHMEAVRDLLALKLDEYQNEYGVQYDVSFSMQDPSTDTLSADTDNQPFRDENGALLFRPGGHGALIKNLNENGDDIVIIKNIDNIVPDYLKEPCLYYERLLSGYLVDVLKRISMFLEELNGGSVGKESIDKLSDYCVERLNIPTPVNYHEMSLNERVSFFKGALHRPVRICGMVRNAGEPGGGPFWVQRKDGSASLQIVESAQVDLSGKGQQEVWNDSTHFNPVNLFCSLRDYRGNRFDLTKYVDNEAVFVSQKSYQGRKLKALELPGLWNGGMADWISVFIEVPPETFNPVKVVNDLLRSSHQPPSTNRPG